MEQNHNARPTGSEAAQAVWLDGQWLWVAFLAGQPLVGLFPTRQHAEAFADFVRGHIMLAYLGGYEENLDAFR